MGAGEVEGSLLAGRYRVVRHLGSGGMASVFLCRDERLGRPVAVKRLHAHSPEEMERRFAREARLGASLNHPTWSRSTTPSTDDEGVLIVMEYVEGESLSQALRRGPLRAARAGADGVRELGDALDHAHAHGVVHRDVKPANVLLREDGVDEARRPRHRHRGRPDPDHPQRHRARHGRLHGARAARRRRGRPGRGRLRARRGLLRGAGRAQGAPGPNADGDRRARRHPAAARPARASAGGAGGGRRGAPARPGPRSARSARRRPASWLRELQRALGAARPSRPRPRAAARACRRRSASPRPPVPAPQRREPPASAHHALARGSPSRARWWPWRPRQSPLLAAGGWGRRRRRRDPPRAGRHERGSSSAEQPQAEEPAAETDDRRRRPSEEPAPATRERRRS